MKKVVINDGYGGFGLSKEALDKYIELSGCDKEIFDDDIDREDKFLIQTIELLGEKVCSGEYCKLKIVELHDDCVYEIYDYDGKEYIKTSYRELFNQLTEQILKEDNCPDNIKEIVNKYINISELKR